MPTYDFIDTNTNEIFEEYLTISDMEEFLKDNPHIKQAPPTKMNIVSGTGMRNDAGWNENLARIAEANPRSALAEKIGGRSSTESKTAAAVNKWRKARAADTNTNNLSNVNDR